MACWCVYLVRARGGVLYAGITTDLERRIETHRAGKGAKFLRGRGPLELVYSRRLGEQGLALRVERRLKALSKAEKEALVIKAPARARLLSLLELTPIATPAPRPRGAASAARQGARGRDSGGNRRARNSAPVP